MCNSDVIAHLKNVIDEVNEPYFKLRDVIARQLPENAHTAQLPVTLKNTVLLPNLVYDFHKMFVSK